MDNDYLFAEYCVKPVGNPQAIRRRLILILVNVVLDLTGTYLCIRFNITLIAAVVLAAVPLWFWSMKIAKTEYEYSVEAGELTLDVIHGNSRRNVFTVPLKSVTAVVPDTEEYADKLLRFAPEVEYVAYSSKDSPDRYYALFTDEDKRRCVFRFDAANRTLHAFRSALGGAVVVRQVRN